MSNGRYKLLRALGIIKDSDAPRNVTEFDITDACGVAADKIVTFQRDQLRAREQLTKLCKLLSMNAGGPVDAILDEACRRLMIPPAVPTPAWYTHNSFIKLVEVCKPDLTTFVDHFEVLSHAAQVIHDQKRMIDDLDESREWDGVEPLFVGAIVEGGTVAVIGSRVCIRDDLDGLYVVRTVDVKSVKDVAVKIIDTAYDGDLSKTERDIRIDVLRNLAQQGFITLND